MKGKLIIEDLKKHFNEKKKIDLKITEYKLKINLD